VLSSLFRSLTTVGGYTLLSRVLGFARDLVYAHVFGADTNTDAFVVAFKIPNFLRRLFGEGAFATAFVPVLTEYKTKRSYEDLKSFVDHMAGSLGLAVLLLSLVGVVAAPIVVSIFAFGWVLAEETAKLALAAEMLRLTFPYLFFISLTAFAGGVLNAHQRFAVPAFTPVLLNLILIASALWLAPKMTIPIVALAWGVLIAGITQFVFQLPFLGQLRMLPRFRPQLKDPGVRRVMVLMIPALFAVSVTQINLFVDTVLASTLVTGSISWLYYSDRLVEFPLGLLGVALGTVILPQLSRQSAEVEAVGFNKTLNWGLRNTLVFGAPAASGLAVLAGPLIATLFLSEVFTTTDVIQSRASLIAYASGLLAFIVIKVLAPAFYARQDTKTPVKIAVAAMLTNIILNLVLIGPLAHAGLALATSLAAYLNAGLLFLALRRSAVFVPEPKWPALLLRVSAACCLMVATLLYWAPPLAAWWAMSWSNRVLELAVAIGLGAGTYLAGLYVAGARLRHLLSPGPTVRDR
jgi:putative peptidoglycan lipid II flippase